MLSDKLFIYSIILYIGILFIYINHEPKKILVTNLKI
jgi:hypothetical protein